MSDKPDHIAAIQDLVGIMRRLAHSAMRETDLFRDEALALRAENARLREALADAAESLEKVRGATQHCDCLGFEVATSCLNQHNGFTAALQETRHE